MLALLVPLLASAAPGRPGLLLPSALPMQEGQVEIGAGAVGLPLGVYGAGGWLGGGGAQADWAVTDRVVLSGAVGFESDGIGGGLAIRGQALDGPGFRLAPWGGYAVVTLPDARHTDHVLSAGLAVEGGWTRVRLDASVALGSFLLHEVDREPGWQGLYVPWPIPEAGVSFYLGDELGHRLRIGFPAITYDYLASERFWFRAGLTGYGALLELGWAFGPTETDPPGPSSDIVGPE